MKIIAELLIKQGYCSEYGQVENFPKDDFRAIDKRFKPIDEPTIDPFADTLEGRRQLNIVEDWLYGYRHDLWKHSKSVIEEAMFYSHDGVTPMKQRDWKIERVKWCLYRIKRDG